MNVLSLLGSPRKNGNSATLARRFCETARGLGAEVSEVFLNGLDYRGCQACFSCKGKTEVCARKDGLSPVLQAVAGCDVLVMASPVYYGEISSQLKAFVDRTFSFLVPNYPHVPDKTRLAPGKTAVMVIAQGHPREDLFADIFPRYQYFFEHMLGFERMRLIRACGVYDLGDAEKDARALEMAGQTAEEVVSGA
ncbi:MAG: flavodoxin family protein [Desulfovibrionaceae bacterium]|nr:flavodoxin family protein [Desulfovibrionaceae bacterium]